MKLYFKLPSHSCLCKYAIRIEEKLAQNKKIWNFFVATTMLPPNLSECQMPMSSAHRQVHPGWHWKHTYIDHFKWFCHELGSCLLIVYFFTALKRIWSYGTLALSDSCRCHESCTYEVVSMYCTQRLGLLSRRRRSISQTQKRYSLHSLCWLARPFREVDDLEKL